MIGKRISDLSETEEIFDSSKGHYEEALKKSGYNGQLQFVPPQQDQGRNRKRNRKRKIIWYNPPFSKNVKTKIAGEFLKLLDKHFPERHKFHKHFNRNNVKVRPGLYGVFFAESNSIILTEREKSDKNTPSKSN